jgi:hypothetical protein
LEDYDRWIYKLYGYPPPAVSIDLLDTGHPLPAKQPAQLQVVLPDPSAKSNVEG